MRKLTGRFERWSEPLLPRSRFWKRAIRCMAIGGLILVAWIMVGTVGFCSIERLNFIDGFFTTCLYISGVGPASNPVSPGGRLFAGAYALLNGLVFLAGAGIFVSPFIHRVLHHFHLEAEEERRT